MDEDGFDMQRNLIVNYLPPTLTQDDIKAMFMHIGPVTNCKLVRNTSTGQSLGYAFIEYPHEDYATRAIAQINGIDMQGKVIKVSHARKSTPEIQNANVYIAGLPQWVSEDKLQSLFSPFGGVLSHKLLTNPDGTSRGAGFVRYSLNSEANDAIEQMTGKTLPDSNGPLTVKLAIPPASKHDSLQTLGTITTNTLAMVGIANQTANVRFNPMVPSNQGVLGNNMVHSAFNNPTPATAVAAALNGRNGQSQLATIYVFGLHEDDTELTLYELFSPFGGIVSVKLIRDETKEEKPCKGYGFVNFVKYDEAAKAVSSMNGVPFKNKHLQVSFKQNKNASKTQYNPSATNGSTTYDYIKNDAY